MFQQFLSNGFLAIIPVLIWNGVFSSKLPAAFRSDSFEGDVSHFILIGESICRYAVFLMPLVLRLKIFTPRGKAGAFVFLLGILLYFLSWLALIYVPDSGWSRGVLGFSALAYTPLIWLVGIGIMADSYYFNAAYSVWHFMLPSVGFVAFHLWHVVLVYRGMEYIN